MTKKKKEIDDLTSILGKILFKLKIFHANHNSAYQSIIHSAIKHVLLSLSKDLRQQCLRAGHGTDVPATIGTALPVYLTDQLGSSKQVYPAHRSPLREGVTDADLKLPFLLKNISAVV